VKWLTPVKPEKNACLASALFQCSLIRSDTADAAVADHKATPPPPMKNARRAAAAGDKTTQAAADHQFVGAQLYTIVHIYLGRVSGTGNRHQIPMDRVPTVSYQ